jgi:hypothetical protein
MFFHVVRNDPNVTFFNKAEHRYMEYSSLRQNENIKLSAVNAFKKGGDSSIKPNFKTGY